MAEMTVVIWQGAVRLSAAQRRALGDLPMTVVPVATFAAACAALAQHAPALVVQTAHSTAHRTADLVALLRERGTNPQVVVVARHPTVSGATAALRAGAADYLPLHSPPGTLVAALRRAQAVAPSPADDLVSLVSHELRAPLMAITGYLEMLQRYGDAITGERAQDFIKRSLNATGELAHLADLLVGVLHHESGRAVIAPGVVPLAPIVQAAISQCALTTTRHRIDATVAPDVSVFADALALQQVVRNLVSNAIKYSPDGGTITVTAEATGAGVAQVTVRDEGIGIPPERLPDLFGRFARLHDQAHYPEIRGMGLGLYLCQQLIQAHGGHIWAESAVGQGSSFFVQVPLARELRAVEAAPLGRAPAKSLPPDPGLVPLAGPSTLFGSS